MQCIKSGGAVSDEYYMQQALREAHKALDAGEVPIGAVVVMNNSIIGRGHNQVETLHDATAHAEMIAVTAAFNHLGAKYLPGATIYVTLEPCLMCCGALYWSKITTLVFGAADPKHGGISLYRKTSGANGLSPKNLPLHPQTVLRSGILSEESLQLMKQFFHSKR
ncbi:nucleoside deaminase [soil metagenome]